MSLRKPTITIEHELYELQMENGQSFNLDINRNNFGKKDWINLIISCQNGVLEIEKLIEGGKKIVVYRDPELKP